MSGQIVDASIVVCPKQRNTDAEQQAIKAGHIPEGWQDQPKRLAQKDRDARWTLKRARTKATTETTRKRRVEIAIPVLGYKNHVSIDRAYGFVRRFAVTNAAAYDGAQLGAVLDKSNTASPVWADTAYRSKANEALLEKNGSSRRFTSAADLGSASPPCSEGPTEPARGCARLLRRCLRPRSAASG